MYNSSHVNQAIIVGLAIIACVLFIVGYGLGISLGRAQGRHEVWEMAVKAGVATPPPNQDGYRWVGAEDRATNKERE